MKIANGIELLEISANVMGQPTFIYPVLLWDESDIILVDSGYPGRQCLPKIEEALQGAGYSLKSLTKVILTHQDLDHIGGLPGIRAVCPDVQVCAHLLEKPYIEGEKKLVKLSGDTSHGLENLPEEMRKAFLSVFENPPTSTVDIPLQDRGELPFSGGIAVIHTPGHTTGHICLYHRDSRLLIAGDALVVHQGKLYGPVPDHAEDIGLAYASLHKLLAFDIEKVVCYHGGLYHGGNSRIEEIIRERK